MATIDGGNINIGDHGDKLLSKLYELYSCNMFLDMCLSLKGKYIYAHKAVLAAASPFFFEKFYQSEDVHFKIDLEHDLKGLSVDAEDIRLLVEFIYRGQVHVPQIKLQEFLNLGVHFQILGLCKEAHMDYSKLDFPDSLANFPLQSNLLSPFLSNEQIYEAISAGESIDCFDMEQQDIMTSPNKLTCPTIKTDKNISNSFINCSDGSTILQRQDADEQSKLGTTCEELNGEKVCDIFYFGGEGIQPSIYLNGNDYDNQELHVLTENGKDLFDKSICTPGDNPDMMPSYQPSAMLDENDITDDTSIEHLLAHDTTEDQSLFPERHGSQARLKVKDSIGGVSLQDTSQGDKNNSYVKLLSLGKVATTIEDSTNESQYGFNQDSNSLGEIKTPTIATSQQADKHGCSQCKKEFDDVESLTQHLWDEHNLGTFHNCILCEFKTLSENSLVKHGKIHFDSPQKMCCVCGNTFKTKATLRNHVLSHSSDRWFKCSQCNSHYTQRHNLLKHLASEHQLKEDGTTINSVLKCDKCQYVSFTPHNLNRHKVRSHTENKPYKCDKCNYSSTDKTTLSKHVRTHTQERPYICDTCGFSFVTVSSLKRHCRSHTKVKPYMCSKCGKVYADKKRLRDHYLRHISLKPFQCNSCSYSTIRNDNLKTHISKAHPSSSSDVSPKDGVQVVQQET